MSDLRRLAAACRMNPDEDTPRLALADALQEADPVRVGCPRCSQFRYPGKTPDDLNLRNPTWLNCDGCDGAGTVIDPAREQWAELIRVQVELAAHYPEMIWDVDYPNVRLGSYHVLGKSATRFNDLAGRERELTAALDHLRPTCPACEGQGCVPTNDDDDDGSPSYDVACEHCGGDDSSYGTGRIGHWHRGGFCCKVPSLSDVWEPKPCPACTDNKGFRWGRVADCRTCKGTGNAEGWQPTPLGRELAALPLVEAVYCEDRVPAEAPSRKEWYWQYWDESDAPPYRLPQFLLAEVEKLEKHKYAESTSERHCNVVFTSTELARDALARAVACSLANYRDPS